MATKGNAKVVSTADGKEYRVDFSLRIDAKKKRHKLTVVSAGDGLIPDGDYVLYPDGTKDKILARKLDGEWSLRD